MTPDQYAKLSDNEKLMYNELSGFAARLTTRMQEVIDILKTAVKEADA